MKRMLFALISIALVALLILGACSSGGGQPQQSYPYGPGGMMGPGMMGPGMMGPGMMGGGGNYNPNPQAKSITIDQAADAVQGYLNAYGGKLVLTEVMEFAWNFYAEVEEKDSGIHAMELLIDKNTGWVYPEMGPNMMWNTKYGMMGSWYGTPTANMTVSAEQAKAIAQRYLDANLPGFTVADAETFYSYYTLHTLNNGQVDGMLSVNGYTGAVWYHTWHGPFIDMKEFE